MPRIHHVQQGECIASIAYRYGFSDWHAIYDHDDNAEFRRERPNPHVLAPGDSVVIPDQEERVVEVPTGARHRFRVRLPEVKLKLHVHGRDGRPLGGKRYVLEVAGQSLEGITGADGLLEETVPVDATRGLLRVFADDAHLDVSSDLELAIGHLDPSHHDDGVRARLKNLGYVLPDARNDDEGELLASALRRFQKEHGLEEHGEIDDATLSKLEEMHKS